MRTCAYCELPIPENVDPDDVYCTRQCLDDHIDTAIKADVAVATTTDVVSPAPATASCLAELSKFFDEREEPVLLTRVKHKGCSIRRTICDLRDEAEKRVSNIETYGPNKLLKTKEYFQARADVLNDLLMMMTPSSKPCSCC